ncbi:ephrin-B1-like [Varroa destructor]|uniref:Ephrin RBD domain-containing protein n=2 Tax=Varroa TaxID=62624 RepID=A0A7M7JWZ5_VARDE|nr:ephrin-B1-like [Varroa destructor]
MEFRLARLNYCSLPWMSVVILQALALVTRAAKLPDIYWNMSNPIFRIDNTDHIIDVNKDNLVFEYDQVNIVCPKHDPNVPEEETEKYIIYNVSKEEYETCQIRDFSRARTIAQCNKPYQSMYFTITFRSFTPQPGGLEFKPGQDYYFIAASEDIQNGENHCLTKNMRVQFKVCCKKEEARVRPTPAATTSTTTFMPNVEENNVIYPFYTHPPSHKPASGGRQDYLDRPDRLGRLDRLGHHRGSDIGDRDRGFPVRRTHHGHHHNSHGGGSSHEASSTVDYWPHIPHAPGQGQFAGGYPSSPRKPDWPHKRPHFKNPDRPVSDDTAVFKKPLNSLERGRAWERAGKKEGLTNSSNSLHQKSSFIGRLLTLVSTSLLMLVIRMMMQR